MRSYYIFLGCLLLLFSSLFPQERPKVGLALSGGGAKGFVHIGVLKVLESINMPIDYISGTSMGSVVGGLYALGYRAEELEEMTLAIDWNDMFNDRIERYSLAMPQKFRNARYTVSLDWHDWKVHLPSGIINGQKVYSLLNRLTLGGQNVENFENFPIPFVCVATDITTGQAVPITHGNIAEAMRASMAIPTVFTAVKFQEKLLVDGGLVRNFPVEDVQKLGADIIIGVDVSTLLLKENELHSFLDILDQTINFQIVASNPAQKERCNFLIEPDLGKMGATDFTEVEKFIAAGKAAAEAMLPQLKTLADSLNRISLAVHPKKLALNESLYITDVETEGLGVVSRQYILAELNLETPVWTSLKTIEEKIAKLYSLKLFQRIGYALQPAAKGRKLAIRFVEKSENQFRIGLRYDSKRDAAILLNTTFRNFPKFGSVIFMDLKLGGDPQFDAQYYFPVKLIKRTGGNLRLNYTQENIDTFENRSRVARFRLRAYFGEARFGNLFSPKAALSAGIRGEYVESEPTIAPDASRKITDQLVTYFGQLQIDTYNRSMFPSRGYFMKLRIDAADARVLSDYTFQRLILDSRLRLAVNGRLTLSTDIFLGVTLDQNAPFYYQFSLGGMDRSFYLLGEPASFLGLKAQERAGKNARFLQTGIQYEFANRKYIIFRWNAGNVFESWKVDFDRDKYHTGWGATLGLETLLGPIEFTLTSGNRREFLTHLNIGYKF